MDQIKEILRQAIKYRFWIVIGVASILPIAAYFAAAGSIKQETTAKTAEVKSASTDVKQYEALRSGVPFSNEATQEITQRTGTATKEINGAWRLLYDKQAPLLDWPAEVSEDFLKWGRTWPENVDDSYVARTILNYIQVYPKYVDNVYATFKPFDFEDGTGLVVAPAKEMLLRPAMFTMAKPPTLGQVWGAQQRLWIQRTVLDVIARLNETATKWDTAPVKEITGLEVAGPSAQDQMSIAKGIELELAPEIVKPGGAVAAATEAATPDSSQSGYEAMMQQYGSSSGGGMSGMMGGAATKPEEVYLLKAETPDQKYQVVPVFVSVLIEQNRVLDLIAAFENSPMTIKVVDIELLRPQKLVQKPEKGQVNPAASGYGMGGGMSEMILGSYQMMSSGYGSGGMGGGYPGMGGSADYQAMMMQGRSQGYGGMYGMGAAAPPAKKGTDIRQQQLKKIQERKDAAKKAGEEGKEEEPTPGGADPYFNIVEVRIYGQARFYNPPPVEEPVAPETTAEGMAIDGTVEPAPADGAAPPTDAAVPEGAEPAAEPVAPDAAAEPETPAPDAVAPDAPDAATAPAVDPAAAEPTPAPAEPGAAPAEPAPAAPAAPGAA